MRRWVNTGNWPWRRKLSNRSCRVSNRRAFCEESGDLPLTYPLSRPNKGLCTDAAAGLNKFSAWTRVGILIKVSVLSSFRNKIQLHCLFDSSSFFLLIFFFCFFVCLFDCLYTVLLGVLCCVYQLIGLYRPGVVINKWTFKKSSDAFKPFLVKYTNINHNMPTQISNTHFRWVSPFNIALL